MATVTCTNAKDYKLTVGQAYDLVKETSDYFYVVNDGGTTAKYVRELFQRGPGRVANAPAPQPAVARPVVPPPPPRRTSRNVIASMRGTVGSVTFNDINNRTVIFNNPFDYESTEISCGVSQVSGLNTLLSRIDTSFNDEDDYLEEKKALLRIALTNFLIERNGVAMYLLSTNLNGQEPELIAVMDEVAGVASEVKRNPNSGNNIKTWIFYNARA